MGGSISITKIFKTLSMNKVIFFLLLFSLVSCANLHDTFENETESAGEVEVVRNFTSVFEARPDGTYCEFFGSLVGEVVGHFTEENFPLPLPINLTEMLAEPLPQGQLDPIRQHDGLLLHNITLAFGGLLSGSFRACSH